MKGLILLAFLVSISYAYPNIDSLFTESQKGEIKAHRTGFFTDKKPKIPITITTTEKSIEKSIKIAPEEVEKGDIETRIKKLEIDNRKMIYILEKHQSQMNSNSGSVDFITKLLEIFIPSLATILAAYLTVKVTKKASS